METIEDIEIRLYESQWGLLPQLHALFPDLRLRYESDQSSTPYINERGYEAWRHGPPVKVYGANFNETALPFLNEHELEYEVAAVKPLLYVDHDADYEDENG